MITRVYEKSSRTTVLTTEELVNGRDPLFRAYHNDHSVPGCVVMEMSGTHRVDGLWLDENGWRALSKFAQEVAEHLVDKMCRLFGVDPGLGHTHSGRPHRCALDKAHEGDHQCGIGSCNAKWGAVS